MSIENIFFAAVGVAIIVFACVGVIMLIIPLRSKENCMRQV